MKQWELYALNRLCISKGDYYEMWRSCALLIILIIASVYATGCDTKIVFGPAPESQVIITEEEANLKEDQTSVVVPPAEPTPTPTKSTPSPTPTASTPSPTPTETPMSPRVAFVSKRDGNSEIYIMELDGGIQSNLTKHPATDGQPAWSPDGTRVAFVSDRAGNREIYVMNANGSSKARLTNYPGTDTGPAWASNGTQIAFTSDRSGRFEVYVMSPDGRDVRQITYNGAREFSWSPDGRRIAYSSYEWYLNIINPDGTGLVSLPETYRVVGKPAWSPDGERIAFISHQESEYFGSVYIANSNGSGLRRLTSELDGYLFAWSPDSRSIVIERLFTGGLYVVDVAYGYTTQIFRTGMIFDLAWLPNGSIGYATNGEIFTVNESESNPINLTNNPGGDSDPDWWWPNG